MNTLVIRDGRVLGSSTDTEALGDRRPATAAVVGHGGAATAWIAELTSRDADVRVFARRDEWPPRVDDVELIVHATPVKDELLFEPKRGQTVIDLAYRAEGGDDGTRRSSSLRRLRGRRRPRRARRAGRSRVRTLDGRTGAGRGDARRSTLRPMTLGLTTAGESHGPALVAILTGLPAGLVLDRAAIDADLHRRQQGYGRSPRQQLERDEVEVLAGLRHGRTLGTPLALVVRNRDHVNWAWGMSPWPPEGEPSGKGVKPVTLPRPGHADLAGTLKFGHDDVRDALERASARQTAVHVAAGAVAKTLLRELGIEVAGSVLELGGEREDWEAAVDAARADRDTRRRHRRGSCHRRLPRPRLLRDAGGAARRTARRRADGDPGREGRRDRRRLRARTRARLGRARRDRAGPPAPLEPRRRDRGRRLERRGDRRPCGDEAAADADAAARLRRSRPPASRRRRSSSEATSRRSKRSPWSRRPRLPGSWPARPARSSAATRSPT